jgi:hypothetical protein
MGHHFHRHTEVLAKKTFPRCNLGNRRRDLFCHQVSYTKEAWARLMENPQNRLEVVRASIEKLGGKLHASMRLKTKAVNSRCTEHMHWPSDFYYT